MEPNREEILGTLRRYWGYGSFRPLQERIVASLLAGHDTCVVMPTGGGKSLCYQLPAAMQPGKTVVVISPLIALMQDQIAQLTQMGIPAASLNSALSASEQSKITRAAVAGEYRLLYLGPERLAREDTVAWLKRAPVAFFAIDEAHCISEWGHEFRPEYRQLSSLRQDFPEQPIAAFTASATRQVRHDILGQLRLREPHKYIASFHRPNLRYLVKECDGPSQLQLLSRALQHHAGQTVIVYSPTIHRVEETVEFLEENGIPALAYHGKMDTDARRRNQERWTSDEVRVMVGTIAFGLGINKPAVRAVVHLALPKSIEQFYQEAGRAGRDGEPADCLLLWQPRDVGLLTYFIEQMADQQEKQRSWQQYHELRRFVELPKCRHLQICEHFGETPKWQRCEACDVCGASPEWLEVKMRDRISLRVAPAFPACAPVDGELADYLREWRRNAAREKGMAAFVIMHDSTMEELCRRRPATVEELRQVSGFGEKKTELYGRDVLAALRRFANGARATEAPRKSSKPAAETARLLAQGKSFEEIASIRGRQLNTVITRVAEMVESGQIDFQSTWMDAAKLAQIEAACAKHPTERLRTIKDALPAEITFEEIRLVVAKLRAAERTQI